MDTLRVEPLVIARAEGSRLAAAAASDFLASIDYPPALLPEIAHAMLQRQQASAVVAAPTTLGR